MTSTKQQQRDLSSLANPHEVCVTHLDWKVQVDFEASIFRATASYNFRRIDDNCRTLQLDTAELKVVKVTDATLGASLSFELKEPVENKPHLGRQLEITLPSAASFLSGNKITIEYETTQASSAIQWLPPTQTAGKVHPYLFTQSQAIHARSMLPCQDQPGVKMTYDATVTVPDWAVCVMSGLLQNEEPATDDDSSQKTFVWKQPVPVSSYLIALAVGELAKKDISQRCAIWSEPALVEAAAYEFFQTEDFLKTAEDIAGMPYVWGRYDLLCLPPSFPYGGMENPCLTFVTPTLLAGDRSLADVVAHEIAHSWTGNLVTNETWDHFWLNEGWTTWFQRKIMARIHKDDKFLDFDAIGGYKTLEDTIKREMPTDFQKLVLPIGDQDPDEAYSSIAYEKGFNFLMFLERRVGKDKFEAFFKAYIKEFARRTLTSDDFKAFFLKYFNRNAAVKDIDWDRWFYEPGMPPETPNFDRSLAEASEQLADGWVDFDRNGTAAPTADIKSWSSNQITCFLDALQVRTANQPLKCSTLKEMDEHYNFAHSKNAEILFRFCQISIASEDETMLMIIVYFMTTQGRMKYVRPLYRALYASKMGKKLAVIAFLQNKDFYHPICAKMIASDLKLAGGVTLWSVKGREILKWAVVAGAVAAVVGIVLSRRRK